MADAAPGRFAIGIGSSSNVIVERWNGVPFVEPYKKVRDVVRFLRDALSRREGRQALRHVRGPGLPARRPARADAADPRRRAARGDAAPRRPGSRRRDHQLAVARRRADGRRVVNDAAGGEDREVVARIFVCPSENADVVRAGARFAIAAYLNVPVYAEFHRWLGPRRGAPADVGRLGGGRPQGRAGGDPRRGRRRPRSCTARRSTAGRASSATSTTA